MKRFRGEQVESFKLTTEGKIEVVFRRKSNVILASYPGKRLPDRIWKEIYAVKDDEIVLEDSIEAKLIPATKESYIFNSEEV